MSNLFNYIYKVEKYIPTYGYEYDMKIYYNKLCGKAYGKHGSTNALWYAYDSCYKKIINNINLKYILSSEDCHIFINLQDKVSLIQLTSCYHCSIKETSIEWVNNDLSYISITNLNFDDHITNYYFRDGDWKLTTGRKNILQR